MKTTIRNLTLLMGLLWLFSCGGGTSSNTVELDDGTEMPAWIVGVWETDVEGMAMHCTLTAHGVVVADSPFGGEPNVGVFTYDGDRVDCNDVIHLKVNHSQKRLVSPNGNIWKKVEELK